MNPLGLIVEYNPFHNGHLYHLKKSLELTKATHSIAVMSGNFVQRGEPAIINKWARTQMAIRAGVDVVFELPTAYATSSAQDFAFGAIQILNATGIVNSLCFGSETGALSHIYPIAHLLSDEPKDFSKKLKKEMEKGLTYPNARTNAVLWYNSTIGIKHIQDLSDDKMHSLLSQPNNVLAIEYLKAIIKTNSPIIPYTIKRKKANYNDSTIGEGTIASATAIRNTLKNPENIGLLQRVIPNHCLSIIKDEIDAGRGPIFYDNFDNIILALLRRIDPTDIQKLLDISEGLENRIKSCALQATTTEELLNSVKTRRYTRTRINRILVHLLTNCLSIDMKNFNATGGPQYLRVLGFSHRGKSLLRAIDKKGTLPLITQPAKYFQSTRISPDIDNYTMSRMLQLDITSTDIYCLGYTNKQYKEAGMDYKTKPINN